MAHEIASRPGDLSPDARAVLRAALDDEEITVTATDPESRRRFLAAYDAAGQATDRSDTADTTISRLCALERATEVALRDWTDASRELSDATSDAPDHDLPGRELTPAARSAVAAVYMAEERASRAERIYTAAKLAYDRAAERWERDSRPLPRWRDDGGL